MDAVNTIEAMKKRLDRRRGRKDPFYCTKLVVWERRWWGTRQRFRSFYTIFPKGDFRSPQRIRAELAPRVVKRVWPIFVHGVAIW